MSLTECEMAAALQLTASQKKAFDKMKRAYAECKLG